MNPPLSYFLARPRYWFGLTFFSLIFLVAHLPKKFQILLARLIAWLTLKLASRRRNIATINLQLCFPDSTKEWRNDLLHKNFFATTLGLFETAACWFTDLQTSRNNSQIVGQHHLDQAIAKGKGVILLSFHLTSLEIGGSLLSRSYPIFAMYKPNKNPLTEAIMSSGRLRHVTGLLKQNDIRSTVRTLKNNGIVWYATDQNYGNKSAVFVPFFGIQASTITATTKFAKLTGATIVPFTQKRINNGQSYQLELHPALEDFPGENESQDAARINLFLQEYLTNNPIDYMWLHQRFRTRPEGEARIYPRKK